MPIHMGEMGYCYHNTNTKKAYLPKFWWIPKRKNVNS
jgi:hypothetical protein